MGMSAADGLGVLHYALARYSGRGHVQGHGRPDDIGGVHYRRAQRFIAEDDDAVGGR